MSVAVGGTTVPASGRRRVGPAVRRGWHAGVHGWRRSLRLRVVTTTVVLSLVVLAVLGTFLVGRVQRGLLDAKVAAALVEAGSGTREAQSAFGTISRSNDVQPFELARDVTRRLSSGGGEAGSNEVLIVRSPRSTASVVAFELVASDAARLSAVPEPLRAEVQGDSRQLQHWTYTSMRSPDGADVPAVVVGSLLAIPQVGGYELYYLFPLDDEQATLSLVQRALAVAGVALVALVGVIAYVVTRQVVTPVRMAARIAERLAAGRLEERMLVRGEDDLARLAASFNGMATSLQRHIRQLEELSRVQRRFVSDVSHELRTPLTTVRMAADVLFEARQGFDPTAARSAELLQAQLDRFEALLTDLLEISRFDAGAAHLETEPLDLRDVAEQVVEATQPLADLRGSAVTVRQQGPPSVVEADRLRVERILRNLVVNAIEHGEGRPIDVLIASDDAAAAVAVRDRGVGLRPGEAALVFNRFWRADPARARTTGGTGLGLSIALEDAHLHGGWLQAWGEPGDGSQFRLTLPRRAGSLLDSSPLPLEPADSRRRARTAVVGAPYRRTGEGVGGRA